MAYRNLRDFITTLEKNQLLKRISVEVDPILEITEITDRVVKKGGPALFFEKVKNSPWPVVTNLFGTEERMCLALECEKLDQLAERVKDLLRFPTPLSLTGKFELLLKVKEFSTFFPHLVKSAPCQEVVLEKPDLGLLPVLKCWPEDGGRFITLPLVFTKDPQTKIRNVGMYRLQVFDAQTTGMHWHLHKHGAKHLAKCRPGEKLEVAVVIGADPSIIYASTAPLPEGFDEIAFAGFLRRKSVKLVKCKTIDLEVPAESEFVLEGYVQAGEVREEGPFGDHTGFYSLPDLYPVFHLTVLTHRKNPLYPATIVGKPPMEDCFLAKATERLFLPFIQFLLPEIKDIYLPLEGVFHNCILISIKKEYPGQGKKVINAIWGIGQLMNSKFVIVLDDDIDLHNLREVSWKVFNNVDPEQDLVLTKGPLDALDHTSPYPFWGSKLGIDATRKTKEEGRRREWPVEIKMKEEIKKLVQKKWQKYGL
jgi:4-hydroxy-3-polyprenylbenzoate decarboxylase